MIQPLPLPKRAPAEGWLAGPQLEAMAPIGKRVKFDAIKDLAAHGMGLLVVEQNLGVATTLAERVIVMVAGSIATETTSSELLGDPDAQKRYLGVEPLPYAA